MNLRPDLITPESRTRAVGRVSVPGHMPDNSQSKKGSETWVQIPYGSLCAVSSSGKMREERRPYHSPGCMRLVFITKSHCTNICRAIRGAERDTRATSTAGAAIGNHRPGAHRRRIDMKRKQIWRIAWVDSTGAFKAGPINWPTTPTDLCSAGDTEDRWIGVIDISTKPVVIPPEAIAAMKEN